MTKPFNKVRLKNKKCAVLMFLITVPSLISTRDAKGTGFPVFDLGSFTQSASHFAERAKNWAETTSHYKNVLNHYAEQVDFWRKQLVNLKTLRLQLFKIEEKFTEIDPDYGVEEICPNASTSLSIASALTEILDMNGDINAQQSKICVMIVRTKNAQYNNTVKYLQEIDQHMATLEELQSSRLTKAEESSGNAIALSADTERFSASMASAKDTWQTHMSRADAQIALLQQKQSVLARRALNGKPSTLGTLINTGTLKMALRIRR